MNFSRNADLALLILRIVFGGAMIYGHGWGKLMRLFGEDPIKFADPFGLGPELSLGLVVFAEIGCALLLILGLYTRIATIPLMITMLVAVLMVHIDDPFARMEKGIMYFAVYLSLFFMGAGWYSLDAQIRKKS